MPKKGEVKLPELKTAKQLLEEEQKIQRLKTNTPIDQLIGGGIISSKGVESPKTEEEKT
jgi:hypothetical protein